MTEEQPDSSLSSAPRAGSLLRTAREKQGMHIAVLAAAIKVAPSKLDALENGRFEELPDATFTRALAQSVCRVLKIDPRPVLELLPNSAGARLERVDAGLNMPFREHAMRVDPSQWQLPRQPIFWMVLALLAAAAAFWLWPARWSETIKARSDDPAAAQSPQRAQEASPAASLPAAAPAPAPPGASASTAKSTLAPAASDPATVVETVHSTPAGAPASGDEMPVALVALRASEPSWVEVLDPRGQVLLQRTLQQGESVGVDGPLPLRVRIGNASATALRFRGRAVDLGAYTRDNVARVDLK